MILLLVLTPFTTAQNSEQQNNESKIEELPLETNLQEYLTTYKIDLEGRTKQGVEIQIFLNNDLVRTEKELKTKEFKFKDFLFTEDINEVKIIINDPSTGRSIEKIYKVNIDAKPPLVKLEIPKATTKQPLTLKGETDELITIEWIVNDLPTEGQKIIVEKPGEFELNIPLKENEKNKVKITAKDSAGNSVEFKEEVFIDTMPPMIEFSNLDKLDPSYNSEITIIGKSSEKSVIEITLNDKKEKTITTDDEGNFRTDIKLERKATLTTKLPTATLALEDKWPNKITLEAIDSAGLKSGIQGPFTINYQICGKGGDYKLSLGNPTPDILNPRLLLQGTQLYGIPFEMNYTGVNKAVIKNLHVTTIRFSPKEEEKYDNNLISISQPIYEVSKDNKNILGYVPININPFTPLQDVREATIHDKEKNISTHRKGECLIPGFGCLKFYIQFELSYVEDIPKLPTTATLTQPLTNFDRRESTVKVCDRIEASIDQVRKKDLIPKRHILKVVKTIDGIIDNINKLLKPITTVNTYLFYSCLAGTAVNYVLNAVTEWNCSYNGWIASIFGKSGFNPDVAETGLCDKAYDKEEQKNLCKVCESSKEKEKWFMQNIVRQSCDRVTGPPAPTLQHYVKINENNAKKLDDKITKKIGKEVFVGSDCAFNKINKGISGERSAIDIYTQYKKDKEKCKKTLRPADPDCCGYEYMREWDTACGLSVLGLNMFDEIKESACLEANKQGKNEIKIGKEKVECHRLWNSVAGFCEPKTGAPSPETILTGLKFEDSTKIPGKLHSDDIYLIIAPRKTAEAQTGIPALVTGGVETSGYEIHYGYIFEKLTAKGQGNELTATLNWYDLADVTSKLIKDKGLVEEKEALKILNFPPNLKYKIKEGSITDPKGLYSKIKATIGAVDQAYIVQPDSSILRSIQCVYVPGVQRWLAQWKKTLGAVNNCLKAIAYTGDGSPGMCREIYSIYVCDFVFDALRCFANKYSIGGAPGRKWEFGGIGNVLGAMSSAATRTQRDMNSRYGETAVWKSLFVEKKLQNSMCAFAFTGTWNLDLEALFQQTVNDIPIPSQGVLQPCKRRFGGYVPTQTGGVKGLTTWIYEMGAFLSPGSDLRWQLKLKCSNGFTCSQKDGFKGGECDCNRIGEKTFAIKPTEALSDTLTKDELLDISVTYPVQAFGASIPNNVRYDTAILEWESTDQKIDPKLKTGKTECKISLTGNDAPAFCTFDVTQLSYRCLVGQQNGGLLLKSAQPEYSRTYQKTGSVKEEVFALNDPIKFKLSLTQIFPKELKDSPNEIKYLKYRIFNEAGKQLIEETKDELSQDGDYEKTIEIQDLIVQTNFDETGGARLVQAFKISPEENNLLSNEDYAQYFDLNKLEFTNIINNDIVLIFEKQDENTKIDLKESTGDYDKNGFKIINIPTEAYPDSYIINQPKQLTFTRLELPITTGKPVYKISIPLLEIPKLKEGEKIQVLIPTSKGIDYVKNFKQKIKTPCMSKDTIFWSAEIKSVDSDAQGLPTNTVSTWPKTGEEAIIQKRFKVVCANPKTDKGFIEEAQEKIQKITSYYVPVLCKDCENVKSLLNSLTQLKGLNFEEVHNDCYLSDEKCFNELKEKLELNENKEVFERIKQKFAQKNIFEFFKQLNFAVVDINGKLFLFEEVQKEVEKAKKKKVEKEAEKTKEKEELKIEETEEQKEETTKPIEEKDFWNEFNKGDVLEWKVTGVDARLFAIEDIVESQGRKIFRYLAQRISGNKEIYGEDLIESSSSENLNKVMPKDIKIVGNCNQRPLSKKEYEAICDKLEKLKKQAKIEAEPFVRIINVDSEEKWSAEEVYIRWIDVTQEELNTRISLRLGMPTPPVIKQAQHIEERIKIIKKKKDKVRFAYKIVPTKLRQEKLPPMPLNFYSESIEKEITLNEFKEFVKYKNSKWSKVSSSAY